MKASILLLVLALPAPALAAEEEFTEDGNHGFRRLLRMRVQAGDTFPASMKRCGLDKLKRKD